MKIQLILLLSLLAIANSYRFTQPGEPKWPTYQDLTALKSSINGTLFIRGEQGYDSHTYNTRTNVPQPAAILKPQNEQDIVKGVAFAQKHSLRLAVQSTGHQMDIRNTADNSLLIDMNSMSKLTIDVPNKKITVQTGAIFGDVIKHVHQKSQGKLCIVSGADGSVGTYGFSVGGGHGRLTRMYGLGADAILNIKLVLANGTIVNANEKENEELFWALRGSGGQPFGVGIETTFQLYENPKPVSIFEGIYNLNNSTGAQFGQWLENAPEFVGGYYLPMNAPEPHVRVSAFCFGNQFRCYFYLSQLQEGCLVSQEIPCVPQLNRYPTYNDYQLDQPTDRGGQPIYIVGTTFDPDTIVEGLAAASNFLATNPANATGPMGCSCNGVMGGVSELLDPFNLYTSVPQALRTGIMGITCWISLQGDQASQLGQIELFLNFSELLRPYGKNYVYWNEGQHDYQTQDEWKSRYWGGIDQYNKLLQIKLKYDPQNFMTCYQCIGWDQAPQVDPALCPVNDCRCSNTPQGQCANTSSLIPPK